MKRGAWPQVQVARKRHIEGAAVMLVHTQDDIDEIITRVIQAMRRSCQVVDVLEPAIERLQGIKADVDVVEQELRALWADERAQRNE